MSEGLKIGRTMRLTARAVLETLNASGRIRLHPSSKENTSCNVCATIGNDVDVRELLLKMSKEEQIDALVSEIDLSATFWPTSQRGWKETRLVSTNSKLLMTLYLTGDRRIGQLGKVVHEGASLSLILGATLHRLKE
jgi:hypothetical protein